MRKIFGIILILMTSIYAQIPHLIGDRLYNADGSVPLPSEVEFSAYIQSRPQEIISSDDPGVSGFYFIETPSPSLTWLIQTGDFSTPWAIGETICINFRYVASESVKQIEIQLDGEAVQSGGDVSLPVELTGFFASCSSGKIILRWTTESEVDNAGFILQRKIAEQTEYSEISSYQYNWKLRSSGNSHTNRAYSYSDNHIMMDSTYDYQLISVAVNGAKHFFDPIRILAQDQNFNRNDAFVPTEYSLKQNYPNPFNPSTVIEFSIPEEQMPGVTTLAIVNTLGQQVKILVQREIAPGNYAVSWDGRNEAGCKVSSGMYLYFLSNQNYHKVKKMVLLQ